MPKILFLTCFIQMISMVGFAIWPIYLIDLQLQWELSNSEAGWVSGSFYIGYVVATPFLVSLTDTFDARKLYSISCIIGSAGLLFFSLFLSILRRPTQSPAHARKARNGIPKGFAQGSVNSW